MPKLVIVKNDGSRYLATVDGGDSFEVGRRVTYPGRDGQTVGLAGSRSGTDKYNPDTYAAEYGVWAYFLAPTALCESNGVFATLNTYDRAFFTWGFLQFGAHIPDGDFIQFFRELLKDSQAADYFPDLDVENGRICRMEPTGTKPLESSVSTQPLMMYLNPTVTAVEDIETVNAAKLVHWCSHSESARHVQVSTGIALFRANMKAYARRYGLDGVPDYVCLGVADIRHQGRGSSDDILRALATGGDRKKAFANLVKVGSQLYAARCKTLNTAVQALLQTGKLGAHKYSLEKADFVAI